MNKLPLGQDGRDAQDCRKTSAFRQHVERHSGLTGHCSVCLQVALLFCEPLPVVPVHALGWRSTPLRASRGRLVLTTRATGLMSSIRRSGHMQPGEFRRSQNCIGGTRPGNAAYVPPADLVLDLMSALERFIHTEAPNMLTLVKAGVVHVQFETIPPFLNGNGP